MLLQSRPADSNPAQTREKTKSTQAGDPKPVEKKKEDQIKTSDPSSKQEPKIQPKQTNRAFIDRDGDGIHDGQEHRFRGRHRRRSRTNQNGLQEEQRRLRRRSGHKNRH